MNRPVKRRELREIFNCSDYQIDKLIAEGILPKGRKLSPTSHNFWLLSDVRRAEQKLTEKFAPPPTNKPLTMRPFSAKLKAQIRAAQGIGK